MVDTPQQGCFYLCGIVMLMQGETPITFTADKIKVTGPKVDGGFTVSFDVGEYEQSKVAKLLTIPQDSVKEVGVNYGG